MLGRTIVGATELASIESELNGSAIRSDGPEDATFARIVRSFLTLDPAKRPRAAEALLDPAFQDLP